MEGKNSPLPKLLNKAVGSFLFPCTGQANGLWAGRGIISELQAGRLCSSGVRLESNIDDATSARIQRSGRRAASSARHRVLARIGSGGAPGEVDERTCTGVSNGLGFRYSGPLLHVAVIDARWSQADCWRVHCLGDTRGCAAVEVAVPSVAGRQRP